LRIIWIFFNTFLSIVICSTPIILFGWLDKEKTFTGRLSRFWARWILWSTSVKYELIFSKKIEKSKQYVFMCNHVSALDIPLGLGLLPYNIIFLAKKELFKIPIFGWAMKSAGMIKIDRKNPEKAKASVDNAIIMLKKYNFSTLIYPEGTRSDNNKLLPFKKGGFILAIRAKLPVVPITIICAESVLPKNSLKLREGKIKILVGDPISTDTLEVNDKDELLDKCRNQILLNINKYIGMK